MMVGRKIDFIWRRLPEHAGDAVLTLENLTLKSATRNKNILNQVSFSVHKGRDPLRGRYPKSATRPRASSSA